MMLLQSILNRMTRGFRQRLARRRRWKSCDPRTLPAAWRSQ